MGCMDTKINLCLFYAWKCTCIVLLILLHLNMRIMQFVLQVNNALENALEYKNMCQCMHLLFLIRVWFLLSNI